MTDLLDNGDRFCPSVNENMTVIMFPEFHMWGNVFLRELQSLMEGGCVVIYYYDSMYFCNSEVHSGEKCNGALLPGRTIFHFPFIAFLYKILKECYQNRFPVECR